NSTLMPFLMLSIFCPVLRSNSIVERSSATNESAFYELIDSFQLEHFRSVIEPEQYYPVFHFISGFRDAHSTQFQEFEKFYKLTEGKEYFFETSIRLPEIKTSVPKIQQPTSGSEIQLRCYEKRFENKPEFKSLVGTYYDEFFWRLVPSSLSEKRMTTISLETKIELSDPNFKVLNTSIDLPVEISPNFNFKVAEVIGDTSLLVATSTIAYLSFSKTLKPQVVMPEWPGYLIAVGYLLGIMAKFYLRWSGRGLFKT
ncbi:hypothetical protein V2H45_18390, partial [Tumidithrix elongata RA019]|nr:hypothetical protein [Tumidithrix elongata RA019]